MKTRKFVLKAYPNSDFTWKDEHVLCRKVATAILGKSVTKATAFVNKEKRACTPFRLVCNLWYEKKYDQTVLDNWKEIPNNGDRSLERDAYKILKRVVGAKRKKFVCWFGLKA